MLPNEIALMQQAWIELAQFLPNVVCSVHEFPAPRVFIRAELLQMSIKKSFPRSMVTSLLLARIGRVAPQIESRSDSTTWLHSLAE